MEMWKRKSSVLSYSWGLFENEVTEKERPQFYGDIVIDENTNQAQIIYPKWLIDKIIRKKSFKLNFWNLFLERSECWRSIWFHILRFSQASYLRSFWCLFIITFNTCSTLHIIQIPILIWWCECFHRLSIHLWSYLWIFSTNT